MNAAAAAAAKLHLGLNKASNLSPSPSRTWVNLLWP